MSAGTTVHGKTALINGVYPWSADATNALRPSLAALSKSLSSLLNPRCIRSQHELKSILSPMEQLRLHTLRIVQPSRHLSSSRASRATPTDLSFPSTPNPTPFEIFHFAPDTPLSPALVKSRYYDLCKLHHPDLANAARPTSKGKERASGNTSTEFKQIVAAYEVLRDPSRRAVYLRSGHGWSGRATTGPVYDFRRGRAMSSQGRGSRGPFPSAAWDWNQSAGWGDPHNPHFRPGYTSSGVGVGGVDGTTGWKGQGVVGTNGGIFLALASLTLLLTPLTVWSATDGSSSAWAPTMGDSRHRDAAQALDIARREARNGGLAKREAIKCGGLLLHVDNSY